jgi:transcription elongation factor Elf1
MSKRKKRRRATQLDSARAINTFRCPVCGARVGEFCKTPSNSTHQRRLNLVTRDWDAVTDVVSGGAFEMNRRRH